MLKIHEVLRIAGTITALVAIALGLLTSLAPVSRAEPPSDDEVIYPLPVITPVPSNWTPKFPFPWSETRDRVTPRDVRAVDEMCQWFVAQYETLISQIDRVQFNRIDPIGDDWNYARDGVQQQVDVLVANLGQAVDFLAPRAQALTTIQDFAGDVYFPIYKGDAFFRLWQQLSNVRNGVLAHQPGWFTGPSLQHAKHWGSEINRSHVCE